MKRLTAFLLAVLLMTAAALAEEISPVEQAARTIVEDFVNGDYAAIVSMLSEDTQVSVGPEALAAAWTAQIGNLGALVGAEYAEQQGFAVALLTHENGRQQLIVGLNETGEVQTLLLQPVPEASAAMERALPEGTTAREVKLFEGTEMELGAEILVPAEDSGVYAVLIHGSGASDRDETVGANKPFRDLAYDLAAQGVGSIRFDKITFAHPELGAEMVEDEYLGSVREALRVLRAETGASRTIAVGHSEGGMLMPWLVTECGFDGGAALAGTPKKLWEISMEQNLAVLEGMSGEQRDALQAQIDAERQKGENIGALGDSDTVFGMTVKYLRHMESLDEIALARAAEVPMLFLWGDADFQVSRADYEAWREGLGDGGPFTYIEYAGLNHLFMTAQPGDGIANAMEVYARAGQVDSRVAADIADWAMRFVAAE